MDIISRKGFGLLRKTKRRDFLLVTFSPFPVKILQLVHKSDREREKKEILCSMINAMHKYDPSFKRFSSPEKYNFPTLEEKKNILFTQPMQSPQFRAKSDSVLNFIFRDFFQKMKYVMTRDVHVVVTSTISRKMG